MTSWPNSTLSVTLRADPTTSNILTGLEEPQPPHRVAIQATMLVIIWILSIPGNLLVCLVIYRSRRVQSTTNYFVVSLAISDLFLTLFCVPFIGSRIIANRWVLGSIMCRLVRFAQTTAPTTAVFVLVSISIDRFYTIIYPLSFKITRGTAKHLIVCCWVLAFVVCIFSIYFFETTEVDQNPKHEICHTYVNNKYLAGILYGAVIVTLTFLVPTLFVIVMYSRIFRYVWTAGHGPRRLRRTSNPVARTKVKTLKMLIVVTVSTLVCFAPLYIVQLWFTLSSAEYVNQSIFIASFLLMFLTTILKPIIYMLYNSNFRRGCREVFCMSNMKCYRSHTYAITTASHIGKKNHVGVMPTENGHGLLQSPVLAFNRALVAEKNVWPVQASLTTTYL